MANSCQASKGQKKAWVNNDLKSMFFSEEFKYGLYDAWVNNPFKTRLIKVSA